MTRILSYNILVGASRRVKPLLSMIRTAQPDIVGLVEATNGKVVEELAEQLEMHYVMSAYPQHKEDWQVALLSRYPIVYTKTHTRPGVIAKPVLEVCVEEPDGNYLTVFVTHLIAAFNQGWAGDGLRRREAREILKIMSARKGTRHLLMGDFNSLAAGDEFKASFLLKYVVQLDEKHQKNPNAMIGHPHLDFVVPGPLKMFIPLLRIIPKLPMFCTIFDQAASLYAPRGPITLLRNAGYIDSFRTMHPHEWGFTCPAAAPAGRIDYIFASPELAEILTHCDVPTEGEGVSGAEASDHLPVVADFGQPIAIEADDTEEVLTEVPVGAQQESLTEESVLQDVEDLIEKQGLGV